MNVTTPWMLITGCTIVGWLLPEILAAIAKVNVPIPMNFLGALAGGLIAGAFLG